MPQVGQAVANLLKLNLRPRDILTKAAFKNCAVTIAAAGGSTNGVSCTSWHWLEGSRCRFHAARSANDLPETPVLCAAFAPRGPRTMVDLHKIGGTPILLKHLLDSGLLDGSCMTVTGKTMAENLKDVPKPPAGQDLIVTKENCYKPFADMQICFGNLAPEGIVFKVSSMKNPESSGKAVCFDDPRDIVRLRLSSERSLRAA
jgi:dihydroxy-acid dehydratase